MENEEVNKAAAMAARKAKAEGCADSKQAGEAKPEAAVVNSGKETVETEPFNCDEAGKTEPKTRETKAEVVTAAAKQAAAPRFSKAQILKSRKYRTRKDLLGVLLAVDQTYTFNEVAALINNFMEGKVR